MVAPADPDIAEVINGDQIEALVPKEEENPVCIRWEVLSADLVLAGVWIEFVGRRKVDSHLVEHSIERIAPILLLLGVNAI